MNSDIKKGKLEVVRPQCLPSKDLMLHHIQAADTVPSVIYNLNGLKIPRSGIPASNSAIYGPLEEKQHPLQSIIKLKSQRSSHPENAKFLYFFFWN